ncbi:MAG: hypothetical protein NT090_17245 [Acidobacteria bacterium]|nr:hypothetical protein [Acidobacteriota bacterium]
MSFTQRRLPHWYPDGKPLFITWRLHDTIPPHRFFRQETMNSGRAFVCWDRLLDEARHGPSWMRRPEIAGLIAASIRYGSTSLGCYTAREANRLPARPGQPFWQAESFDRWVRNAQELERIRIYIENNPVSAGLVAQPEEYRWSSACQTAG